MTKRSIKLASLFLMATLVLVNYPASAAHMKGEPKLKILFKVAVAIMKVVFPTSKELENKDDYETSQILGSLPKQCVEEDI